MKKKSLNNKGFTLVETLLVVFFIVYVFLGFLYTFPHMLKLIKTMSYKASVTNVINAGIEILKTWNFDDITNENLSARGLNNETVYFTVGKKQISGTRTITVTNYPANAIGNNIKEKLIEVTFYWIERGKNKSLKTVNIITR